MLFVKFVGQVCHSLERYRFIDENNASLQGVPVVSLNIESQIDLFKCPHQGNWNAKQTGPFKHKSNQAHIRFVLI